ncbi:phosphotransferase enzyme family protein [Exiguobacterium flavidum]|uniref:phosphotransferase enzyme family protein n=1 Tax=Exiguobacterium flavidum TaxID=2184695 RepID=UPI000DF7EA5C|nr:phosphotransferase [Exiguobacterium flavidum]
MENAREQEERLTGGNVSSVFKVGDTVRRETKPGSDKVHRLLRHLEAKGLTTVPRFLGVDEQGREMLSFVAGEAGDYPLKDYMWSDEVLVEAAAMLRQYHDAVSDFPLTGWEAMPETPEPLEVICHNDFAVYNVIFDQERPVGVIDFDMAAPGPRLWDVAYTLYTFAPLSRLYHSETGETIHYEAMRDAERIKRRVRLFLETYGKPGQERELFEMVVLRVAALSGTIRRKASEGDVAFQKMLDEGHADHYDTDVRFIQAHKKEWV